MSEKLLKPLGILDPKQLSMMIVFKHKKSNFIYSLLIQKAELTKKYEPKPICPIEHALR